MNPPKISVIVPVYNVEKYLNRCIDSILAQTFKDFEVLLIDDGSTDQSGKICDEYGKKDNRVRVFHKKNGGVSSARNMGLDNARGKWTIFIDADDSISIDYFDFNVEAKTDIIQKSYKIINETCNKITIKQVKIYSITNKDSLFRFFIQRRENSLWNKFIFSEIIGPLRFKEHVTIGEDFLFFLDLIPKIHKYTFNPIGEYNYYIHTNSAMDKIKNNNTKRIKILMDNINNIKQCTNDPDLYYLQQGIIYTTYVPHLFSLHKYMSKDELVGLNKFLLEMNIKKCKYVPLKTLIKLYIKKYLFL